MTKEDDVIVLTQLGLTKLQAEVYLTLIRLGKATAKTVGADSSIDRANVYRVIISLQKRGLVEKTITKPTFFKAIDIQEAINMLLKQKAKEYKEVEIKTKKIIKNYLKPHDRNLLLTDECQFALVPENTEVICKLFNEKSERNFDLIFYLPAVLGPDKDVRLLFKKLIARNIQVRILICLNGENKQSKKIELFKKEKTAHFKDDKFEVRYTYLNSPITLGLLDNRDALLNTSPFPHGTPSLWTNNPVLVSVLHDFFEKNWLNSQKDCANIALT